jgi:predicted glycosyltransferase
MNFLFDIGHPAHVHLYRNIITGLKDKGHSIFVSIKDIPSAKRLLELYRIPYIEMGRKSDHLAGKALNQLRYDFQVLRLVKKHKIDLCLGGMTTAQAARLTRAKSIIMDDDDDEVQPLFVKYAYPFCNYLISPDVLRGKRKRKDTIYYPGYHELAYLHPHHFQPDPDVLREAGVSAGQKFFLMRFNVFKAHHDIGAQGISLENKLRLVKLLNPHGKVFITTEREIEPELSDYQLRISPKKAHSLLYFASMFIGDSQTMTSEAAVLGTPAIRCNSFVGRISYLEEEEHKYGLTYGFTPDQTEKMFTRIEEFLASPSVKDEWQAKRNEMLGDKIDVSAFMAWLLDNFPESMKTVRNEPEIFHRFR